MKARIKTGLYSRFSLILVCLLLLGLLNSAKLGGVSFELVYIAITLLIGSLILFIEREKDASQKYFPLFVPGIVGYFVIGASSLIYNSWRYPDTFAFLRYGALFYLLTICFFVLSVLAIIASHKVKMVQANLASSVLWLFFSAAAFLGCLQALYPSAVLPLLSYFHAHDMAASGNVTSVFRVNTDFGLCMALLSITSLHIGFFRAGKHLEETADKHRSIAFIVMAVLFVGGGLFSNARGFLFAFALGLLFTLITYSGYIKRSRSITLRLYYLVATFSVVCVGLLICVPKLAVKYGAVLPIIDRLHLGEPILLDDLLPEISTDALTGRAAVWTKALEVIAESPWIGVSNGAFRLLSPLGDKANAHNLFLQLLIDAGFIGGGILIAGLGVMLYHIIRNPENDSVRAGKLSHFAGLSGVVIGASVFDYLSDHSIAWQVTTAFCLGQLVLFSRQQKRFGTESVFVSSAYPFWCKRLFLIAISVVTIGLSVQYYAKLQRNQELDGSHRALALFHNHIDKNKPVLLDGAFVFTHRHKQIISRYNIIKQPALLKHIAEQCMSGKASIDIDVFSLNRAPSLPLAFMVRVFKVRDGTLYWYRRPFSC